MTEINSRWKGFNFGAINTTPDRSGGILILARKDMDMTPIKTGEDTKKEGRLAWGIFDTRDQKLLIIGLYGPPGIVNEDANIEIFEQEIFQLLDNLTYDKIIVVGDWNV